ncbi:hypothetical protein [Sphingomonas sp.]|uniref:hypothetical protein n=1 Tax=Sphingomonas sp. TaxID=28214 RepID=UPI003D6CAC46
MPNITIGAVIAIAATVLGVAGPASPAAAGPVQRTVAANAAPAAWLAYAEQVNVLVTGWLSGSDPAALHLRADLDATRAAADQSSAPLTLRLWIDARGSITRVQMDPIAPDRPIADIDGLLVGRTIGTAPPKDMLLPLRLAVQLDPAPAAESQPLGAPDDAGNMKS